ncbi:HD-GYP domain-containing protein [Athalassotoga saccharophila]|uniref:HD-GYP domain-containing protein n=1 Tax=Athalassotoga saccharophila TaxID=1441386 RepID=UPI00137A2757|nr:HD domain-containing phosphohydrolase [Athalassotoga saccharophila]BBJ28932.1 cyclic di-GMP phosphodiesterase [Athalassotoga saccharophila]
MKKISISSKTKRFYAIIIIFIVAVLGIELYTLLYVRHIYDLKSRFDSAVMTFNPNFYDQEIKKLRPIIDEIENVPFARSQDVKAVEIALSNSNLKESNLDALKLSVSNLFNNAIIDLIERSFLIVLLILGTLFVVFYIFVSKSQKRLLGEIKNLSAEIEGIFHLDSQNLPSSNVKEMEIVESSMKKVLERYEIYNIMRNITIEAVTIEDLTRGMYENLKNVLKFNRIAFASVEEDRTVAFVAFSDSKILKLRSGFSQKIGQNSLSKIKKDEIRYIKDLEAHLRENPHSESTRLLVEEGMRSSVTIPIFIENSVRGFLFLNSFEKDGFNDVDKESFNQIRDILNIAYQKTILTTKLVTAAATSFTELSEKRDEETGAHIVRMATYSRIIAEGLSYQKEYASLIDENFLNEIYRQAPLHDIGKIGIPDHILLKKGKLTPEEFEIMKTHTVIGYDILQDFDDEASKFGRNFFTLGKLIARYHHERWDGKGYPDGLVGGKIPLCARIVAVGDVLDALTTRRPYKAPFDFETSFSMILSENGTHFDPSVIKVFEGQKEKIRNVYEEFKRENPSEYV